ncbi:hypothetical protein NAT51_07610 [Flavobacterium amniphilum]|uniref:hypothetical protein n=1 Tax=Flavobacterium amniphilum TaxID=1834035 RepID=UPI00202A3E06|nr:hypothetical protein [Flavobacterium amniphilum]MCL9805383.1 hypothetical protein [Flavobacterium amniphilum]
MNATTETGHAKNVANFQNLITFVNRYGTTYNPSKDTLKIPHLNTIATNAQSNLSYVIDKHTDYSNAVTNRHSAFENLKKLSTRIINELIISETPEERIGEAKDFNRKIQEKIDGAIAQETNTDQPAPSTINTSLLSYDMQIHHFMGLIALLKSEPGYKPNEGELKIDTLIARQNDLIAKNHAVLVAHSFINSARNERNQMLYSDNHGLVDIAAEVKNYVKSVYGSSSPEFSEVKGIEFEKVKM